MWTFNFISTSAPSLQCGHGGKSLKFNQRKSTDAIELCLWYSDAIQGQETDSRHILLYSLILSTQFWIVGAQETKLSYFKLAFWSLLKRCHLWPRPAGETDADLVSGLGVPIVAPYTTGNYNEDKQHTFMLKKIEKISLLCLLCLTLISSIYPRLEHLFRVPKVFELFKSGLYINTFSFSYINYIDM